MKRVLIVEDEFLIRLMLEEMLAELEYEVAGSASKLTEGLAAVENFEFEIALLDVNLAGEDSFPIAEALRIKRIPYLLVTGAAPKDLQSTGGCAGILNKPFNMQSLSHALQLLKDQNNR